MPSLRPALRALSLGLAFVAAAADAAPREIAREIAPQAIRSIRLGTPSQQLALTRGAAWRDFTTRHGRWNVVWNEVTGTPHRAFGRGIALRGFADDRAAVDRAVRGFIAENGALLGPARDLELVDARLGGNIWYVRYRQTFGGLPVLFSSWEFRVARDGKLVAFGADVRSPSAALLAAPRIGTGVAREAAKRGLDFDAARDRIADDTPLYVLPFGRDDYRLVYAVAIRTQEPRAEWHQLVDAATGELLYRQDRLGGSSRRQTAVQRAAQAPTRPDALALQPLPNQVLAAISGTSHATVHNLLPTENPLTNTWSANQYIRINATQVTTSSAGTYSATCTGSSTLQAGLSGPYVVVTKLGGTSASLNRSPVACPSPQDIFWNDNNSHVAERDAFVHVNRAHDYIKSIDPACTASDYPLGVSVNSVDDECVVYYDGFSIIFGLEGELCINMATMPDMIYREWCQVHNDDFYFALGSSFGMTNGAINAGTSDAFAAFMTGDPQIGTGIEGSGTFLRSVDNDLRWPEDRSTDPNNAGLILAGAYWDLSWVIGIPTASRLLHFAKYGLPGEPPPAIADDGVAMGEYFIETLVADDNDSDISNGTPHFNEILAAFNAHGIGTANFLTIDHDPLGDQLTNGPYPVTATIQYSGPIGAVNPASPTLYYSVNGLPYESQAMAPTGNPDEWGGEIPAQSGAIVRYYISAAESFGGTKIEPAGAPTRQTHFFIAGPASSVISWDMESNPGWTTSTSGASVTGAWTRVDPISDGGQSAPEDDHTPNPGVLCWVTGQGSLGGWPGENDVDNGTVTLTTGTFNAVAGGITFPIISYWRWYSNNAGEAPGSDTWRVEISNNGGSSWTPIENTTNTDQYWLRVVFFVDDYVTPTANMRMRFIASDTGDGSLVEAGVDDFEMLGFFDPTVSVGGPPTTRTLALAPAAPNPFRGSTRLQYTLPRAGAVRLVAYDIHGREMRRLVNGVQPAGDHQLRWDGRDDAGRAVPSGPYFLKLEHDGERRTLGVVRVR